MMSMTIFSVNAVNMSRHNQGSGTSMVKTDNHAGQSMRNVPALPTIIPFCTPPCSLVLLRSEPLAPSRMLTLL